MFVEFKTFFIVRQMDNLYLLEGLFLVVPAGLDPRLNVTQGRYNYQWRKSQNPEEKTRRCR